MYQFWFLKLIHLQPFIHYDCSIPYLFTFQMLIFCKYLILLNKFLFPVHITFAFSLKFECIMYVALFVCKCTIFNFKKFFICFILIICWYHINQSTAIIIKYCISWSSFLLFYCFLQTLIVAESKTECEGDCKNGGSCESGKCLCKKGYFGSFCQYGKFWFEQKKKKNEK